MTFAKRILLGSAAALVMAGGAQAADLPLAEPVEYVKVCNTYGEGFFYIPGSETCLQIGGFARFQLYNFDIGGDGYETVFNAQTNLNFDARTETEYGTLRSFVRLEFTRYSGIGDGGAPDASSKLIELAFVQFAGLTAGLATSFFDFYANSNIFGTVAGSDEEAMLLAYTATFGTGFSATISLEDQTERRFMDGGFAGASDVRGNTYGKQGLPDVVGNLRVEQGWGAAQLSGALHENVVAGGEDKWGWAVQAGVKFDLGAIAEGDTLILQASYADGAMGYLEAGQGIDGFGYGPYGFGDVDDFGNIGGNTDRSKGYVLAGEFLHYWSPTLRSVFAASYSDVDAGRFAGFDFKEYIGVGSLVWSPVKKLDIGLELGYARLDYDENILGVQGQRANKDTTDAFTSILRVQRGF